MPTVTIIGTFSYASANNFVDLIVSDDPGTGPAPAPTTPGYPTHHPTYRATFMELHNDVISGQTYDVSIDGMTLGTFRLQIIGDLTTPIDNSYSGNFSDFSISFITK